MVTRDVWRLGRPGALDRLALQSEELPAPAPGHARVAVGAVGLNFADVFACLGLYSAAPKRGLIPGLEFAGTVEAVGEGAAGVAPGDRVIGVTRFGGYATRVNADARYLRPLPAGWTVAEGAAMPVQRITAWYAISELGACKPGGGVLVQSAAGGVGLNALAILRGIGARVVAAVGSESKAAFLVDHDRLVRRQIIVRDRRTFASQLDEALRANALEGFDLVLDAVAGPFFMPEYGRLRPEGRLVVYGSADLTPPGARPNWLRLAVRYWRRPRLDPMRMVTQNRSVMGFNLIWLWERVDRLSKAYAELGPYMAERPYIGRRFPFREAPAALRYLQSGAGVGKVILET